MELLKLTIINIKKKKILIILMLIELILYIYTIMSLSNLYTFRDEYFKKLNQSISSEGRYYFLPYQSEFYVNAQESKENKLKLIEFIKNDNRILGIGSFRVIYLPSINIKNYRKIYESFRVPNFQNNENTVNVLKIDYEYFKLMNLSKVKGEIFKKNDFYNKNCQIPVLVGYNYKKYYDIGDEININKDEKYKIIGFLPKDYTIFLSSTSTNLESAASIIICPENLDLKDDAEVLKEKFFGSIQFIFKQGVDYEKAINDFYKESKQLGIEVNFISFKDNSNDLYKSLEPTIKIELTKTIIFLSFTLVGVSFLILYTIRARKNQFGVLICTGIKMRGLILSMVYEWFFLTLVAYLISVILFINIESSLSNWCKYTYGLHNLGIGFASTIFIFFITSIGPIIKILRIQPRELIGGVK